MQVKDVRHELAEGGFLSVTDAEAFSSLKKSKLYALMASGELAYAKIGAARRIPRRALVALMAHNLVLPREE